MFKVASMCGIGLCVEVDTNPQAGVGGFSSDTEIGEGDVAILFSYDEWGIFIIGVKSGEFDV